jgi:hypothetical protein
MYIENGTEFRQPPSPSASPFPLSGVYLNFSKRSRRSGCLLLLALPYQKTTEEEVYFRIFGQPLNAVDGVNHMILYKNFGIDLEDKNSSGFTDIGNKRQKSYDKFAWCFIDALVPQKEKKQSSGVRQ